MDVAQDFNFEIFSIIGKHIYDIRVVSKYTVTVFKMFDRVPYDYFILDDGVKDFYYSIISSIVFLK